MGQTWQHIDTHQPGKSAKIATVGFVCEREGVPLIVCPPKPPILTRGTGNLPAKLFGLTCSKCGQPFQSRSRAAKRCHACQRRPSTATPVTEKVCVKCGKRFQPPNKQTSLCKECRANYYRRPVNREMRQIRFKVACRYIINQGYPLAEYRKGIQFVVKHLYDIGLWDSALEIAMAFEIIRRGWRAKHQFQIMQGQRVDFFFPDYGLVLEVDGHPMHFTPWGRQRDAKRDASVEQKGEWVGKVLGSVRVTGHTIKGDIRKAGDKVAKAINRQSKKYSSEKSDKYNWMFGPKN